MATMQSRLADLITALGTDYKQFRTWITGSSTGNLTGLATTDKTNLVGAINEVRTAALSASVPDATTTVKGKVELATNAEALALADSAVVLTPSNIGSIVNVANGIPKLDATGRVASAQAYLQPDATTTVKGLAELATDAEALGYASSVVVLTPSNLAAIRGVANGVATLDGSGLVPAGQLPSFVDDVLEYANLAAFPATGVTGKIYVALDTNKTFRWGGSAYTEISASPGSTDAVPEGSINLYFTNARADARADARITALVGNTDTDLVAAYTTAKA